jgi:hypothetical protein
MKIVETSLFTRQVRTILSDDEYRELQNTIIRQPDRGDIIQGGGGLRKIRWQGSGKGKRGCSRTIYYYFKSDETVLMLFIYKKSDQDDLSSEQIHILKCLVEKEFER